MKTAIYFTLLCFLILPLLREANEVQLLEDLYQALNDFNIQYKRMWWLQQSAEWMYGINITKQTTIARNRAAVTFSNWLRKWKFWARDVIDEDLSEPFQQDIERMASGVVFMDENDSKHLTELKSKMAEIYSSAKVSLRNNQLTATGEGEVSSLMGTLRDSKLLLECWKSWRMQMEKAKPYFMDIIHLANKASKENGYADMGAVWRSEVGADDQLQNILNLWNEVKDFYIQLHTYTKYKLGLFYKDQQLEKRRWIPAHLLGSLWGENWSNLANLLLPYPEQNSINITKILASGNFSVEGIVRKAEEFYTSMGFEPMKQKFWQTSMFEKPKDRLVDCHPASFDLTGEDYRIRMCGKVKEQTFLEAVHEFGHVMYFASYNHLPMMFHNGANSAFHESIGETMVYAAQNPFCLQEMDLMKPLTVSNEMILNLLMKQALSKFVLLPWALTVETWRYKLFANDINEKNMISDWWHLRKYYQGIDPPDDESATLFDPGSKYHILQNIPYMRYFLGRFLEHHFLDALCKLSGNDFRSCCFVKSKKAGAHLKYMLSLGSSVPWEDAFETLTSLRTLSAEPLMEYYSPLYNWLMKFNKIHNLTSSWKI